MFQRLRKSISLMTLRVEKRVEHFRDRVFNPTKVRPQTSEITAEESRLLGEASESSDQLEQCHREESPSHEAQLTDSDCALFQEISQEDTSLQHETVEVQSRLESDTEDTEDTEGVKGLEWDTCVIPESETRRLDEFQAENNGRQRIPTDRSDAIALCNDSFNEISSQIDLSSVIDTGKRKSARISKSLGNLKFHQFEISAPIAIEETFSEENSFESGFEQKPGEAAEASSQSSDKVCENSSVLCDASGTSEYQNIPPPLDRNSTSPIKGSNVSETDFKGSKTLENSNIPNIPESLLSVTPCIGSSVCQSSGNSPRSTNDCRSAGSNPTVVNSLHAHSHIRQHSESFLNFPKAPKSLVGSCSVDDSDIPYADSLEDISQRNDYTCNTLRKTDIPSEENPGDISWQENPCGFSQRADYTSGDLRENEIQCAKCPEDILKQPDCICAENQKDSSQPTDYSPSIVNPTGIPCADNPEDVLQLNGYTCSVLRETGIRCAVIHEDILQGADCTSAVCKETTVSTDTLDDDSFATVNLNEGRFETELFDLSCQALGSQDDVFEITGQKLEDSIRHIVDELVTESACRRIILEQLSDRCQKHFDDDSHRFLSEFLLAARVLLKSFQDESQGTRRRPGPGSYPHSKDNNHQARRRPYVQPQNSQQPHSANTKSFTPYGLHRSVNSKSDESCSHVQDLDRDKIEYNCVASVHQPQEDHNYKCELVKTSQNNHDSQQPQYNHSWNSENFCSNWPVSTKDRVLIHFNEPTKTKLRDGDSYFYVAQSGVNSAQLVLRHMTNGNIQEFPLPEEQRSHLFDMEGDLKDISTKGDENISCLLSQCLVAAEKGIERMTWDQVKLTALRSREDSGCYNFRILPAIKSPVKEGSDSLKRQELKATYRKCADGTLVKEETLPRLRRVELPVRLSDVRHEVLSSGAVIMTNCTDRRGGQIVVIFCRHPAWELDAFSALELAKLLLYFQSIPSDDVRKLGLTIIVDARGTTLGTTNCLLEGLYTLEASLPKATHIVHVLVDRIAQMLLFKSPMFRPQGNVKIDLVSSIDSMYQFVDRAVLPPLIGGDKQHDHRAWLDFRMKLDPFLNNCRTGAKFLVEIMHELSLTHGMPHTTREARELITQHGQYVQRALDEPVLAELRLHGEDTLTMVKEDMMAKDNPDDYRSYYEGAKSLFGDVKASMYRLVELADDKLHRLEQCLQLRQFEEQAGQILNWLCTEGEDILKKHRGVADNLKAIRAQQADFDKAYFTAVTELEKGADLVEEASMLSQSEEFEQVTGIKEISKELKGRMKGFSTQLDHARETINSTAKCYQLLDQCYEWALEAMKYVATMKMDKNMSAADIDKLLSSLESYLSEHPPVPEQVFESMEELSTQVDNDKLQEQCKVAHSRCMETEQLLRIRQSTLKKAKEQIETEELLEQERRDSVSSLNKNNNLKSNSSSQIFGPVRYREPVGHGGGIWEQPVASSPVGPSLDYVSRRRSYAGKPSAPIYSPTAAAFKENLQGMNLHEYEEHLFYEGLITEDMSDRIVASLPKGLSNSTMRNSRESLRGSQENVQSESKPSDNDTATPPKDPAQITTNASESTPAAKSKTSIVSQYSAINALTIMLNKHSKPHKKVMRRAASCMMPESVNTRDNSVDLKDKRNGKTLSMTTSTDSLPSLPEDEPLDTSAQTEKRHTWAPVSVNTQVLAQQRGHNATIHQSMADLRVAEEDIKRRRQLQLIMTEMIDTEKDYVNALQFVIDNYLPEIVREDVPQSLRGKRNIVFGNIENIYEFHSQHFLAELEACKTNPYHICHCFLNHEKEFYLYALYNKNKPKSDHLMTESHGREFFRQKQAELGDKMDLSSYLLKPVQRMGKYSLLLKQIIKECAPSSPEYPDLKAAYNMVKFQLRHGNDLLAMDCLQGADVNLNEQGMLLRQDTFLVWHGRRKALRHVFLFEEMVVFSKTKRTSLGKEIYSYKSSIKTSDLGLTENVGDNSRYKFEIWFRKRTSSDTFILQAASSEVKNEWVREISRLLWKQAIKNREMRLAEMQRMGAGSKPCIDLKPSKDNIQDRFVNISLVHRRPKSRSSIAVSNVDHLKNGNKRPHSLISVSSTSSSSSSGMYGGGPLSITLESPYESSYEDIKPLPRSATVCSNESGIVEDISNPSSPKQEDACTQTTLRRPPKKDISKAMSQDVTANSQTETLMELGACGGCERTQSNSNDFTESAVSQQLISQDVIASNAMQQTDLSCGANEDSRRNSSGFTETHQSSICEVTLSSPDAFLSSSNV